MRIRRQVQIAVFAAVVVLLWAIIQLVVPWIQRTLSDPELERPRETAELRLLDEPVGLVAHAPVVSALPQVRT